MIQCSILVLPPPPSAPKPVGARPPRQFFALDRFASELATALGTQVLIIEGELDQAPADGFILVLGGDLAGWRDDPALSSRCVPLGATLGDAFRVVSALGMPAAVTSEGYLEWQQGLGVSGLVTDAEVARAAGLTLGPSRGSASMIEADGPLPATLASYLQRWPSNPQASS
ncbi:MAG: hypothetical protein AAF560_15080 [Acidobacteriota bacterium]